MERIEDWDEYFLRHVYLASWKSKDPRTKIGAVLVKDKALISEGYNGFPRRVCDNQDRYLNRELKYKLVVHGEANAILDCVRRGISTVGAFLYTQGSPCHECCKQIIQAGISKIIIHKQWPNLFGVSDWEESIKIGKLMLYEAGIKVRTFDKTLNVTGMLDGREIYV